jgi:hypothetical protein
VSVRSWVLIQFATVVATLVLGTLLSKFWGSGAGFLLVLGGLPLLAVSGAIVLSWAIWRPRRDKLGIAVLALLAGSGVVAATPWLKSAGDRLFFETRRARLETFTRDVLAYGRIHEMSDGLRHHKQLNGELVAYTTGAVDTTRPWPFRGAVPVEQVLARDGIDRREYEAFRQRLRDLKLIEFEIHPGYVAYLYDGFLDNLEGYLHVQEGHAPPGLHGELFSTELVALKPLGGGWYWFGTT